MPRSEAISLLVYFLCPYSVIKVPNKSKKIVLYFILASPAKLTIICLRQAAYEVASFPYVHLLSYCLNQKDSLCHQTSRFLLPNMVLCFLYLALAGGWFAQAETVWAEIDQFRDCLSPKFFRNIIPSTISCFFFTIFHCFCQDSSMRNLTGKH